MNNSLEKGLTNGFDKHRAVEGLTHLWQPKPYLSSSSPHWRLRMRARERKRYLAGLRVHQARVREEKFLERLDRERESEEPRLPRPTYRLPDGSRMWVFSSR